MSFSYLWKIILDGGVIDKTITAVGLLLAAIGVVAGFFAGQDQPLPWWLGPAFGLPMFLGGIAWAAANKAYGLEQYLSPRVSISDPIPVLYEQGTKASRRYDLPPGKKTFQLEITNESDLTITRCSVREARLVNTFGKEAETPNRPFRLARDHHALAGHDYADSFDLRGRGDSERIEIVGMDELSGNSAAQMLYALPILANPPFNIPRKFFPHKLLVRVTGDNMRPVTREFEIGITPQGQLYMNAIGRTMNDQLTSRVGR